MTGQVLVLHVHTALLGATLQLLHSTPEVSEMILAQFTWMLGGLIHLQSLNERNYY